jgi:hypothetical protein
MERNNAPDLITADQDRGIGIIARIPPEAVVLAFDAVCHVIRTSADIRHADAVFRNEMDMLVATVASVERRLEFLRSLVLNEGLSDEMKLRIIDTICEVAAR